MREQTTRALAALAIVVFAGLCRAENLSPLGQWPDWKTLEGFQQTITHDDFLRLLTTVYAPHGGWEPYIRVDADQAVIRTSNVPLLDLFTLRFAPPGRAVRIQCVDWRDLRSFNASPPPGKPLAGLTIALDPGHLGGRWARMEERSFQVGVAPPVQEGDMTLRTAELLKPRLEAIGAKVALIRTSDEPATPLRAPQLVDLARQMLSDLGTSNPLLGYQGPTDPQRTMSVQWQSEALFARAEIRARGRLIKESGASIVICLHYNAEHWGDEKNPTLVSKNHLHLLINGGYEPDEIERDDVRFEMLVKLLDGSHEVELPAAQAVATSLAVATGLPPFIYTGPNAVRAGSGGYVWARNLLANRVYPCPVVYIEPYVMNSPEVFARVQAGDYEGARPVAGAQRQSIFREYADAVAAGMLEYGREARGGGQ